MYTYIILTKLCYSRVDILANRVGVVVVVLVGRVVVVGGPTIDLYHSYSNTGAPYKTTSTYVCTYAYIQGFRKRHPIAIIFKIVIISIILPSLSSEDQGWEFIKENKKVGNKKTKKQELNQEIDQEKRSFSFFLVDFLLVAFLVEFLFSGRFLGRVLVF